VLALLSILLLQQDSFPGQVERALRDEGLVGSTWALVWPESTIVGAAGLRNALSAVRLDVEDRVHVGSVAKTLVATGVLRLVSEGRLRLDQPLHTILPDLRVENPWHESDPILIRHLLDHTAGLDDARLWQVFSLKARPDAPLASGLGGVPLVVRSTPGRRMSYSNTGYTVLGMIIEAITGARYEEWLDENMLRPLGMTRSTFRFTAQKGPHADPRLAMGHFEDSVPQAAVPAWLRPAGQFTTTAADMATFARFLMGNGRVGDSTFIEEGLLRQMGRPSGTEASDAGLETGYALGMSRRDRHGVVGTCHAGSTVGYRAMLCLFPQEGKAFFTAHNADSEDANYGRFDSLAIHRLGISRATAPAATASGNLDAWIGRFRPAPSRFQQFAWIDRVLRTATLEKGAEGLEWRPTSGAPRGLEATGGALLRARDRVTPSHVAFVTPEGRRMLTDGFVTWEQVDSPGLAAWWVSVAAGLLGLAWLVGSALVRLVRRTLPRGDPVFWPTMAVLSLILPLPLFLGQSFLALGDLTVASAFLALVTLLLPTAMAWGLWRLARTRAKGRVPDAIAMAAVLQLTLGLAVWGLIPLRLWQ
jgi:CubicO group peptidase (beta-lactamase class C family)